jgi:ABC-type transporter Mla maintaining outer membrane lipid asymmetry ATPase subunit MlaF
MPDLISLEEVRVTLGGYSALRGVSVGFEEGRSTVIMGPSGCGKSTLLKVAAGLIPADSGRVRVGRQDIFQLPERRMRELRRSNGFVFQDSALWENKSLRDNLALPLEVHFPEMSRDDVGRRVARLLARMGLEESSAERPAALSGGERKIASFLRALVTEPTLLFLDEPTLSIDHAMAERINQMIREMKARGSTIVAVTHDAELTATLADRIVVMDEGAILAAGTMEEMRRCRIPRARAILSQLFGEIAAYDTDLLELLDGDGSAP